MMAGMTGSLSACFASATPHLRAQVTASLVHRRNPSRVPCSQKILLLHPQRRQQEEERRMSGRGCRVIMYAGPTTFNYVFAFIFPLSLIAVTVFTSIKIADELDRKFLEEVAVNQEILEAEEGGSNDPISLEGKPDGPRKRNRPKRQAEAS